MMTALPVDVRQSAFHGQPMPSTLKKSKPPGGTAYADDLYAWVSEQVAHLRAGRFDQVDAEQVAEELEDLGKSEKRELESALAILMAHMLKWQFQPERRSRSWALTIKEQRNQVSASLLDSPSLKNLRTRLIVSAYRRAVLIAARETDLPERVFPESCPYDWDAITSTPYLFDE